MKYYLFTYLLIVDGVNKGMKDYAYGDKKMLDPDVLKLRVKEIYQVQGKNIEVLKQGKQVEITKEEYESQLSKNPG